jgi:rare lipoprotein A (peptidoglycan hydrolase)
MIARARRAFPGMVVSMLLAAPALLPIAAHAQEGAPPPRRENAPLEVRKLGGGHKARGTRANTATASRARPITAPFAPLIRNISYSAVPPVRDLLYTPSPGSAGGWRQSGTASWYGGPRWQGKRMASGSTYDQNALTAAHATLPLWARVRVTVSGGQRSVVVTITDRPGTHNRIIDLSQAAARALGILDRGIATVTLEPA